MISTSSVKINIPSKIEGLVYGCGFKQFCPVVGCCRQNADARLLKLKELVEVYAKSCICVRDERPSEVSTYVRFGPYNCEVDFAD